MDDFSAKFPESLPEKPKVGRPSLGDAARARVVKLRVTNADAAQWDAAADREGISLSEWLRAAAELAIARGSTR